MPFLFLKTTDEYFLRQCASLMCKTEPWITLGRNFDMCMQAVSGESKEVYVYLTNETLTAFAILQMEGSFKGYIQSICVSQEARGMGIGNALLEFCEQRIFQISPNVFICVSSFNVAAAKLYYRRGFEKIGELKDFIVIGHSEILLRKTIGPISKFVAAE